MLGNVITPLTDSGNEVKVVKYELVLEFIAVHKYVRAPTMFSCRLE